MSLFDPGPSDQVPADQIPADPGLRVRMTIAYDGTGFRGFAAQPGQITVAGQLAQAIAQVTGSEV
ncbi:MAG: hypothetical protein ACYCS7_11950, partial [Acidimicrobiales bacterium]